MRNNEVIFSNMRNFHNYIKRELIIKYAKNEEKLIDLCCGKGGDMHKWINAKIKNILKKQKQGILRLIKKIQT
jgi:mRNA (guanine-N7-)-methyltransferase